MTIDITATTEVESTNVDGKVDGVEEEESVLAESTKAAENDDNTDGDNANVTSVTAKAVIDKPSLGEVTDSLDSEDNKESTENNPTTLTLNVCSQTCTTKCTIHHSKGLEGLRAALKSPNKSPVNGARSIFPVDEEKPSPSGSHSHRDSVDLVEVVKESVAEGDTKFVRRLSNIYMAIKHRKFFQGNIFYVKKERNPQKKGKKTCFAGKYYVK